MHNTETTVPRTVSITVEATNKSDFRASLFGPDHDYQASVSGYTPAEALANLAASAIVGRYLTRVFD